MTAGPETLRTPYATRAPVRTGTLLLDRNEGAAPPWPADTSVDRLLANLNRYPDAGSLERRIADRFGVPADRVLVTAGADDAIDRTCRSFLRPGTALLTHRPTFAMLARYATLAGADRRAIPWTSGPFPLAEMLDARTSHVGLIALVSPNNPTGRMIPTDAVRTLIDRVAPTPVLLDLAYIEYAPEDPTAALLDRDNVVVVRTLSKAWGLAGCRVGFALSSPETTTRLRTSGSPYPVARPSIAIATETLTEGATAMADHVARIRGHRDTLICTLKALGTPVLESVANFVLAEWGPNAAFVRDALLAMNVLVRDFTTVPELHGALRISVPGSTEDLATLQHALHTITDPEAVLFDLDGVLVDVEASYQACITGTAASFGVDLDPDTVTTAKAGADSGNDWRVTERLLRERGVCAPYADIVARFQALYRGTNGSGLRERERTLVDPSFLARLARRYRIGVVTGRPRDEALDALERFGLRPFVHTLVTMDDAPSKPDPRPVQLALDRLGVSRAWMLGDTPDDVLADRAAGALPFGVAPAGPDTPLSVALRASGPVRILDRAADLTTWIPQ